MTKARSGELQLKILGELYRSPVCVAPSDLAKRIDTRPDHLSIVIRRLEAEGFTQRAGRGCWEITDAGALYVQRVRGHVKAGKR